MANNELGILLFAGGAIWWLKKGKWKEQRDDPDEPEFEQVAYVLPSSIVLIAYEPYKEILHKVADLYSIGDPLLLAAIIWKESTGNPQAEGGGKNPDTRGLGLMQITYSTAKEKSLGYDGPRGNKKLLTGLFDPATNITWATKLLANHLKRQGDLFTALKRYRGAKKDSTNRAYAQRVINIYDSIKPWAEPVIKPEM